MTTAQVICGKAEHALRELADESADSFVSDPPAAISFLGKQWDTDRGGRAAWVAYMSGIFREALRVTKVGGFGLVWALPRTSHWTATALEDAGFEVRDVITHHFGQGNPKSLDLAKAIDKQRRDEVEHVRAFLKVARDRAGFTNKRVAALFGFTATMASHWIDHPTQPTVPTVEQWYVLKGHLKFGDDLDAEVHRLNARKGKVADSYESAEVIGEHKSDAGGFGEKRFSRRDALIRATVRPEAQRWQGWGTALKPASEHWLLVRRPTPQTVVENVLRRGVGALNVAACRVGLGEVTSADDLGERYPSNLVLSHSPACDGSCAPGCPVADLSDRARFFNVFDAERFVYEVKAPNREKFFECRTCARAHRIADLDEHEGHDVFIHPTQKSVALMRWLVRLVTPPSGVVLDCFAGTGTTGVAAAREGFGSVLIEEDADAVQVIHERVPSVTDERPARRPPEVAATLVEPSPSRPAQESLF